MKPSGAGAGVGAEVLREFPFVFKMREIMKGRHAVYTPKGLGGESYQGGDDDGQVIVLHILYLQNCKMSTNWWGHHLKSSEMFSCLGATPVQGILL